MEFGFEKCAMLVVKKGKVSKSDGVKLPDDKVSISIQDENGYKYFCILQLDQAMCSAIKEKVGTEYKRRVKKVLKSKLNRGNMTAAISTWAVPLVRHSAPFLDWQR